MALSDEDLLEFLEQKSWSHESRLILVAEWNHRRAQGNVGRITMSAVRTPCRLKQIISSMALYIAKEKD